MGKLLNANAGASSSCLRVGGVSITSKIGTQHFCGCQLPQDAELRERDRHTHRVGSAPSSVPRSVLVVRKI